MTSVNCTPFDDLMDSLGISMDSLGKLRDTNMPTLTDAKNAIGEYVGAVSSTAIIDSAVADLTAEVMCYGSAVEETLDDFNDLTDCFGLGIPDFSIGAVLKTEEQFEDSARDIYNLPEKTIMKGIQTLKSQIARFKFPNLFGGIDEILSCAIEAAADIFEIAEVQAMVDIFDDYIEDWCLDDTTFELSWPKLEDYIQLDYPTIDTSLLGNLESISDQFDVIVAESETNVETALANINASEIGGIASTISIPETYF